jgi:hypothetical protein
VERPGSFAENKEIENNKEIIIHGKRRITMDAKWIWTVGIALLTGTLCLTSQASPINYGDRLGTTPSQVSFLGIVEDSGTDPNVVLYGAPRRVGNRLSFTPKAAFSSYSANGSESTSGTLTMEIVAPDGYFLEKIVIKEMGDYTLTGSGNASAVINGLMTVLDLDDEWADFIYQPIIVTPSGIAPANGGGRYTLPSYSFGIFNGVAEIDLTGLNIRHISFNFNNNLQTSAGPDSTAFIQKKQITDNVSIDVIVPEPCTFLSLLTFGLLVLKRRYA